jgi:hypothetical protein
MKIEVNGFVRGVDFIFNSMDGDRLNPRRND